MIGNRSTIPADLLSWASRSLPAGENTGQLQPSVVAGDASHRRYFRLRGASRSYIAVEAPPATENTRAFLAVRDRMARAEVRVPALLAADVTRGFMLLEDLGDQLLLAELNPESVASCYCEALELARRIARVDMAEPDWPEYDSELLDEELQRFSEWFVSGLLGYSLDGSEAELVRAFSARLVGSALEQPRVLVHRDFHSRNLMRLADGGLAVIDFQDAVRGPLTYDAVSLLRDCYIRWPSQQVTDWARQYRRDLVADGMPAGDDEAQFLRWFDWMGLQRHIKVLGTFARLHLRDGKSGYLGDLPLVVAYVREILCRYEGSDPLFAHFHTWFDACLTSRIAGQSWSHTPCEL